MYETVARAMYRVRRNAQQLHHIVFRARNVFDELSETLEELDDEGHDEKALRRYGEFLEKLEQLEQ